MFRLTKDVAKLSANLALFFRSGFEQANKYVIMDANGHHIGYMAEQERGMTNMMARQWFRTHRSFVTHVFDRHENEVLRVSFEIIFFASSVALTLSSFIDHSRGLIPVSGCMTLLMLLEMPPPLQPLFKMFSRARLSRLQEILMPVCPH